MSDSTPPSTGFTPPRFTIRTSAPSSTPSSPVQTPPTSPAAPIFIRHGASTTSLPLHTVDTVPTTEAEPVTTQKPPSPALVVTPADEEVSLLPEAAVSAPEHTDTSDTAAVEEELPYPTHPTPLRVSGYTFPLSRSTANGAGIPCGVELLPLAMLQPPAATFTMPPVVCSKCGGARAKYCVVDLAQGTWKCVLCGLQNVCEGQVTERMQEEFSTKAVDYIIPSELAETLSPVFRSGIAEQFLVFVIDANLTAHFRDQLSASLSSVLNRLPNNTMIGLILVSDVVCVYEVGLYGVAMAEAFSGATAPSQADLDRISSGAFLCPVRAAVANILSIVDCVCPVDGIRKQPRSIGTAVMTAVSMIESASSGLGGVVSLLTTGAPSRGPGSVALDMMDGSSTRAVSWFTELGKRAERANIAIDTHCIGNADSFGIAALSALANCCGGIINRAPDYSGLFARNLYLALSRFTACDATLSVRCSKPLVIAHVIGPVTNVTSDTPGRMFRCRLGRCGPRTSVAVTLQVGEDLPLKEAYVQMIVHFTTLPHLTRAVRVVTQRVRLNTQVTSVWGSADGEILCSLLAKTTVTKFNHDGVHAASQHIDRCIAKVARAPHYSSELPPPFLLLPYSLYHLRRGCLLGGILPHPDDGAYLRFLCLSSDFMVGARLMVPLLLRIAPNGTMEEVLAEISALQSNAALLMDAQTDIILWFGSQVPVEDRDAIRATCAEYLSKHTALRLPQPRLIEVKEGTSESRYLHSRLLPAPSLMYPTDEPPLHQLVSKLSIK